MSALPAVAATLPTRPPLSEAESERLLQRLEREVLRSELLDALQCVASRGRYNDALR